uniref:C2H2-type domain-containing protein n=1 Tax=Cacopsylla melanoneura TaxID=428564 RepID=A0A8D9EC47_9HEMI
MFSCNECSASFKYKSGLNKHNRKKHEKKIQQRQDANMFCFMCNESFCYTEHLRSHLTGEHDINLEVQKLTFDSFSEFELWRKEVEHESNIKYIQANGTKRAKDKDTIYLRCNRTGVYRDRKSLNSSKKMKIQGTCKINNHCTSSMVVELFKATNSVQVKFFKDHFGHDIELQHLPLSSVDKDLIVCKLLSGASADTVVNEIRDSMTGTDKCERIHLVTKKHVKRIGQCFGVTPNLQKDRNDGKVVESKDDINESKNSNEHLVMLYKNLKAEVAALLPQLDKIENINHMKHITTHVNKLKTLIQSDYTPLKKN